MAIAIRSCAWMRRSRQNASQSPCQPFFCGEEPMKLSFSQPNFACGTRCCAASAVPRFAPEAAPSPARSSHSRISHAVSPSSPCAITAGTRTAPAARIAASPSASATSIGARSISESFAKCFVFPPAASPSRRSAVWMQPPPTLSVAMSVQSARKAFIRAPSSASRSCGVIGLRRRRPSGRRRLPGRHADRQGPPGRSAGERADRPPTALPCDRGAGSRE